MSMRVRVALDDSLVYVPDSNGTTIFELTDEEQARYLAAYGEWQAVQEMLDGKGVTYAL